MSAAVTLETTPESPSGRRPGYRATLRRQLVERRLALPADLALLVKTFITLEGLGRSLAPDFHMATEAEPLLEAAVRARYSPRVLAERGWTSAVHGLRLLGRYRFKGRLAVVVNHSEKRNGSIRQIVVVARFGLIQISGIAVGEFCVEALVLRTYRSLVISIGLQRA